MEIASPFGTVKVKKIKGLEGGERLAPEYEVCKRIAMEQNLPLQQVYAVILKAAAVSDRSQ